jgi:hypothetical protein
MEKETYYYFDENEIEKFILPIVNDNIGLYHKTCITIYTNQQFKKTIIRVKNNRHHIYTNFKYKQNLYENIITNINTQNKYNYYNSSKFYRCEITVYSKDQHKFNDKDRNKVVINIM